MDAPPVPAAGRLVGGAFGPNAWLVDDMYEQFRADPGSVSESWREFFADYVPPGAQGGSPGGASGGLLVDRRLTPEVGGAVRGTNGASAPPHTNGATANGAARDGSPGVMRAGSTSTALLGDERGSSAPKASSAVPGATPDEAVLLRGAAARIVANMEASLAVPTATSVRSVPAKLLQVNRARLNQHLSRATGGKVSFTHLIGYAIVQGLRAVPALNVSFVADGDGKGHPAVRRHRHVGLGLAVDVAKADGSRTLLVPVLRDADLLDFRSFVVAYEDMVRKVHAGKLSPDDFVGATVTLTNPGTLGTVQSVPRLMPGQGAIIGVGSIDYPAEYQGADRQLLADLGIGPVVTVTSTYDHRVVQGAESGLFLAHVAQCLLGEHDFYEQIFASMDVPLGPEPWQRDRNPFDDHAERLVKQVRVQSLINMYRVRGHLIADLDPLAAAAPPLHTELDPATYGLTVWDLDRKWVVDGLAGRQTMALGEALDVLRNAYCRTMGIEYMHIQDPQQKRWVQEHVEGVPHQLPVEEQRHVLDRLNAAEAFERFLHTRYVGQKRFGLEGAESAIVMLDTILSEAAKAGLSDAVIGMAHRGRLNVLANIVGKSYREIFREFEGDLDPDSVQGSGDVKYHKGASGTFVTPEGQRLALALASNPSHLEAVDPVVEGMVRARQERVEPPGAEHRSFPALSLLIHGDAAFAGQGVVAETLELSQLAGYRTGGSIHLVINNQLGFTTAPESARSSVYPTDVAKMVQAPIIHVNGDDPEACVRAARLAFEFRQAFHKDVVIDMVCYRRHGHNEGDDPSYTQPIMYGIIDAKRSVRKLYTELLVRRGDITLDEAERALDDFQAKLQQALDETRQSHPPKPTVVPAVRPVPVAPVPDTGVERGVLDQLVPAAIAVPEGFTLHPKLARQFAQRSAMVAGGEVDWALGEALAFGSILLEGTHVRLSGQDTRRGTFSQRHAVLVDHATGAEWIPLAHLDGRVAGRETPPGRFGVYDSLLSEYAAVGFEYGYAVEAPDALVAWEAQFGDFSNGAQIIIDNFLVSAEDKWGQRAGLVLLLPHGYEGQGPEHSSARIERFLTLCASGNMRVTQPTTAAQYFHLLRSQVRSGVVRPLVIFTPKSLLRARQARSPLEDLTSGRFAEVVDDPATTGRLGSAASSEVDPSSVQRIVLCSGKGAFEVMARRDQLRSPGGADGVAVPAVDPARVAVVRVEQLYPWPEEALHGVLGRYPSATEVIWWQEEPENMGAWSFVHGRLHRLLRERFRLVHVSRAESASPATGSAAMHHIETEDLLTRVFGELPQA